MGSKSEDVMRNVKMCYLVWGICGSKSMLGRGEWPEPQGCSGTQWILGPHVEFL